MFWVTHYTGDEYCVYAVRYTNLSSTFFLIFTNDAWVWVDSKNCVPSTKG